MRCNTLSTTEVLCVSQRRLEKQTQRTLSIAPHLLLRTCYSKLVPAAQTDLWRPMSLTSVECSQQGTNSTDSFNKIMMGLLGPHHKHSCDLNSNWNLKSWSRVMQILQRKKMHSAARKKSIARSCTAREGWGHSGSPCQKLGQHLTWQDLGSVPLVVCAKSTFTAWNTNPYTNIYIFLCSHWAGPSAFSVQAWPGQVMLSTDT